jgi:hypothetical protein
MLWLVVVLGFSVPFAGLVSRRGKRDPSWLVLIVAATLLGQGLRGRVADRPGFRAVVAAACADHCDSAAVRRGRACGTGLAGGPASRP